MVSNQDRFTCEALHTFGAGIKLENASKFLFPVQNKLNISYIFGNKCHLRTLRKLLTRLGKNRFTPHETRDRKIEPCPRNQIFDGSADNK